MCASQGQSRSHVWWCVRFITAPKSAVKKKSADHFEAPFIIDLNAISIIRGRNRHISFIWILSIPQAEIKAIVLSHRPFFSWMNALPGKELSLRAKLFKKNLNITVMTCVHLTESEIDLAIWTLLLLLHLQASRQSGSPPYYDGGLYCRRWAIEHVGRRRWAIILMWHLCIHSMSGMSRRKFPGRQTLPPWLHFNDSDDIWEDNGECQTGK